MAGQARDIADERGRVDFIQRAPELIGAVEAAECHGNGADLPETKQGQHKIWPVAQVEGDVLAVANTEGSERTPETACPVVQIGESEALSVLGYERHTIGAFRSTLLQVMGEVQWRAIASGGKHSEQLV